VSLPLSAAPLLNKVAVLLSAYHTEASLRRGSAVWANGSFPSNTNPRLLAQRFCLRFFEASETTQCDALSLEALLRRQGVGTEKLWVAAPMGSVDVSLAGRMAVLALHHGEDARVAASAFCARHRSSCIASEETCLVCAGWKEGGRNF